MNRMKTILWCIMVMALCLVTGCADDQRIDDDIADPDLFGTGDPPAEYVVMFGNDNSARLDYVQNQDLAKIAVAVNKQGIVLAELIERVKKLEDWSPIHDGIDIRMPASAIADHSKCILDMNGKCMTTRGCKVLNPDIQEKGE